MHMLLISANSMAPQNSTESYSIRIKNLLIEKNVEMFFLFVTLLPTCTGVVAVIKPPVTCDKFDLPGWQILSCDRAKIV